MIRTKKHEYQAKTLILAFGAEHRKLDIPGEDDLSGLGVSYCATCDGAFYKDRTAVVVGRKRGSRGCSFSFRPL